MAKEGHCWLRSVQAPPSRVKSAIHNHVSNGKNCDSRGRFGNVRSTITQGLVGAHVAEREDSRLPSQDRLDRQS